MLQKHKKVQEILGALDSDVLLSFEKRQLEKELKSQIADHFCPVFRDYAVIKPTLREYLEDDYFLDSSLIYNYCE